MFYVGDVFNEGNSKETSDLHKRTREGGGKNETWEQFRGTIIFNLFNY